MAKGSNAVNRLEFNHLKEQVEKLEKIYDVVQRQIVIVEKLTLEMKYMREDQNSIEKRVQNLENKPVKRYDTIISNLISVAVGAFAAFIGLSKK